MISLRNRANMSPSRNEGIHEVSNGYVCTSAGLVITVLRFRKRPNPSCADYPEMTYRIEYVATATKILDLPRPRFLWPSRDEIVGKLALRRKHACALAHFRSSVALLFPELSRAHFGM